jgi:hypothetical protein
MTCKNITHSIRESFYFPDVTEEDFVRISGSLNGKESTGIDDLHLFTKKMCPIYNKVSILNYKDDNENRHIS